LSKLNLENMQSKSKIHFAYNALFRFVSSRKFMVQYGASLAAGFGSFIGLALLGRVLPNEDIYSQVAAILGSFNFYFVFMDLGFSAELMRDVHKAKKEGQNKDGLQSFLSLLYFRLIICALAIPIAVFHGVYSGQTYAAAPAFGMFALSFIGFAVYSTFDSYYFAINEPTKAVSMKTLRFLSSLLLPLFLLRHQQFSLETIFSIYLLIVIALSGIGIFLHRALIGEIFSQYTIPDRSYFLDFVGRCLKSSSALIIATAGALAVQMSLYKGQGMNSLATYIAAISLLSPVTTAMQTISQLVLMDLGIWAVEDITSAKRHILKSTMIITLFGFFGGLGLYVSYRIGLIELFLRHIDHSFPAILLFLTIQMTASSVYVQFINFLQFRKQYRILFFGTSVFTIISTPVLFVLSGNFGVKGYAVGSAIISICNLGLLYYLYRSEIKKSRID
jgi:O-antigen/teichoic acid export membrane protein